MNVADMWACLQDHQADHHWRHVAGWRKICDLAGQHLTRLRTYRDGLARAWPPETNTAARVYLAELDDLIDQVQSTHDAAAANQSALSAATQALTSTRTELKKIYDEYATKLQQKRAWDETAADPKAAAGSRATQPPVTDTELERLNIQARGIMYGLSGELQQAQVMLRQPPPPHRAQPARDQPAFEGNHPASGPAPIIPPILPVPLSPPSNAASSSRPSSPARPVPTTSSPTTGPVLGAAPPGPVAAHPNPTAPVLGSPAPPSPGFGALPPAPPSTDTRPASPAPGNGQSGRPNASGPNPRIMPFGGVIGGAPNSGLGRPTSNGEQVRRVNPVGGVIGGGAAGTAPTGAAGSRPGGVKGLGGINKFPNTNTPPYLGMSNLNSPGGIRADHRSPEGNDLRRWDPDHPWETDRGVSPVVRPPDEEGPIDPGPAIGINR
ncbi:hypothetical protein C1I93_19080 [Micromonospora endophytica]|uniref:Uncharacterized protein n=1 Tax=Micromonospora endophytica TaxID=515350 RepID=A0A2W2D6C2_9ACTN|nr:hypothetical protein [Micromonospora endophytica]PZF92706.1 hypothetical protein C1I93_19080 [Micromonospora endophytica]RIW45475.1 hypothetical protein D3H59_15350 [Micromonospora endophytica]